MRIVIDKREQELINKTNEALTRLSLSEEAKNRIEVVVDNLPIGDILIQTADNVTLLIIERKTFSDLLASIKDGRYEEQSHRLLNTSELPPHSIIYLLEGMFSNVQPSSKKLIYSTMTSLHFFKGFGLMRTSSVYETAEWLIILTEKMHRNLESGKQPYYETPPYVKSLSKFTSKKDDSITPSQDNELLSTEENTSSVDIAQQSDRRSSACTTSKDDLGFTAPLVPVKPSKEPDIPINYCNFVKKVKKDNITPENIGEIVLSQIPGISAITAIAIMKKFSRFPKLMNELKENPDCLNDITTDSNGKIRKISKSCIENIKKYFL
jgi:ERCC4-type nuclease